MVCISCIFMPLLFLAWTWISSYFWKQKKAAGESKGTLVGDSREPPSSSTADSGGCCTTSSVSSADAKAKEAGYSIGASS
ncbi:hypothetical protein SARC_00784 [Sphaeroforma arctica JP610]|uniref:Uncharacterized protein n=1 Tax=Sphaeroforma arctica JP610 TaxID=667725 RepID=A0A0L0GDZ4_9EUKA|nr:hypothetical protein SARC_00784 [Sphaeroforma arctica JP610]KNC87109.1 hypothetical protein SARC_00784 [Sphaeroforma arctica JP610]|eukprot:XP_014161011.1 hypothetical protein SARC_00784 [Sphaeroforma arctica JP610]